MSDTDFVDSISVMLAPAIDVGADVGELHEHDVAQAVLREVGDPDRRGVAVDAHPLVLRAVPQLVRNVSWRRMLSTLTRRRSSVS